MTRRRKPSGSGGIKQILRREKLKKRNGEYRRGEESGRQSKFPNRCVYKPEVIAGEVDEGQNEGERRKGKKEGLQSRLGNQTR